MLLVACLLFLALGGALASPSANLYVETVLYSPLQNELRVQGLEPAALPDFNTEFQDKLPIIGKVKGKAEHSEGNLTGLSRVRRFSECLGPYFSFGAANINCTIAFDMIEIKYKAKVKYGKLPKVNVKVSGNITGVTAFVNFASQPGSQVASLKSFQFVQLGQQKVQYTGLGSQLNKMLKFLHDGYKTNMNAQFFGTVSQRFQNALNRAVAQVPLPQL